MSSRLSSLIYGTYTGLVYGTPLIGGWIADRYIGQRRAVMIGIVLMALGHFAMASEQLLFVALLLLIAGSGFFKTNTMAQVGMLYGPGDSRRDRAYSVFYVGTNLGAFIAPLVAGTLGEKVGWHYGFGAAGVGMMIALAVYVRAGATCRRSASSESRQARIRAAQSPGMESGRRPDPAGDPGHAYGGPAMSSKATPSRCGPATIPTAR